MTAVAPHRAAGAEAPAARTAVLVLGMHRSGTSVLTRLLGQLGAALPADTIAASPDNPQGFWEPAGLARLNEAMMRAAGTSWFGVGPLDLSSLGEKTLRDYATRALAALDKSFPGAATFAVKDPRMCRMLPFYRGVLANAGIRVASVLALRHPAEVAASLNARDRISFGYGGFLWARHALEAERHSRGPGRFVVDYARVIEDWAGVADGLLRWLGDSVPPLDLSGLASPVQTALRRQTDRDPGMFAPPMATLLPQLHEAMLGLATEDGPDAWGRLDALGEEIEAAAARQEATLEVEFRIQRLTARNALTFGPEPAQDRIALAAALARLHHAVARGG